MYVTQGTAGVSKLPVNGEISPLLPAGGLVRGSAVSIGGGPGATSLAMALVGTSTQSGSWVCAVGLPDMGLSAASEMGVDLDRLLLVDHVDPQRWPTVVATLLEATDIVLATVPGRLRPGVGRRLGTLCRKSGGVLVTVSPPHRRGRLSELDGFAPQVRLEVGASAWEGTSPGGHGHLRARSMTVTASGRGRASRPMSQQWRLPGSPTAQPVSPTLLREVV